MVHREVVGLMNGVIKNSSQSEEPKVAVVYMLLVLTYWTPDEEHCYLFTSFTIRIT